jgi:hypothetical protein
MDGEEENNGLASSRNEKAGMADESAKLKAPGTAGEGGCEKSSSFASDLGSKLNGSSPCELPWNELLTGADSVRGNSVIGLAGG